MLEEQIQRMIDINERLTSALMSLESAITTVNTSNVTASNDEAADTAAPTGLTGEVGLDEVKALIFSVAKANGRDSAANLLAKFGVSKIPELHPGQYADVVSAANDMLEEVE